MIAVEVRDSSQVAVARRTATGIAATCGAGDTDTGRAAIVATELATNLLKHGGGGELLISTYDDGGSSGVQLIALDKGRGMGNIPACLQDGYSSAGSAGNGLGAIQRQSSVMEIASWPGLGTVILVQIRLTQGGAPTQPPHWGALGIPKPGEEVCGDATSVVQTPTGRTSLVVDGLGHGPEAAIAALAAVRIFQREAHRPVTELLDFIHAGLRPTRGAAAAIARWRDADGMLEYGGVGNIASVLIASNSAHHMVSINGTLGLNARKMQTFDYPCPRGSLVIMHSDGLSANWSLDKYPGLIGRHPMLIAAVLYRDYARHRDDVSVLVARSLL